MKAVTGRGWSDEIFVGKDLVVFNKEFPFNARKAAAHRCPPVEIFSKRGYLTKSALRRHSPVKFKCYPYLQLMSMGK